MRNARTRANSSFILFIYYSYSSLVCPNCNFERRSGKRGGHHSGLRGSYGSTVLRTSIEIYVCTHVHMYVHTALRLATCTSELTTVLEEYRTNVIDMFGATYVTTSWMWIGGSSSAKHVSISCGAPSQCVCGDCTSVVGNTCADTPHPS